MSRSAIGLVAGALAALWLSACGGKAEDPPDVGTGGTGGAGGADTGGTGGGDTGGTGGTSTGGTGGTGGAPIGPPAHASKLDLLFMIDNSASMADKQATLAQAVPELVARLSMPACVDAAGNVVAQGGGSDCPGGSQPQFPAVTDIHLGVITSSLGGHGADICSLDSSQFNPHQNDRGHLITRGYTTAQVPTYDGQGFLNWDPTGASTPPGEADPSQLTQRFADITRGAGQIGCGFESSLEAWYRFLVDPAPYETMEPAPCNSEDSANMCRAPRGVDQVVLQQRKAFLRQDSAVGIIMMTDENDCSVIDAGQNYLALQVVDGSKAFHMARGTSECDTDPYSPACKSCWQVSTESHPECAAGWSNPQLDDPLSLRCFKQKQRFGIDFLQPTSRYVTALTQSRLEDGTINPLFCLEPTADGTSCATPFRDRTQIVLTGIVGVPWVDIARDPEDLGKGYKRASDVNWPMILGEPMANVDPGDPLMRESVDPREGSQPVTGEPLGAPGSGVPNSINGSEWIATARADLQYACTFRLPHPVDCTDPANAFGCDCGYPVESPLCWNDATQAYGTLQVRGKAYPGLRHLSVLQGLGSQAVVASICAPNVDDPTRADYGYGPAVHALVERLADNLNAE